MKSYPLLPYAARRQLQRYRLEARQALAPNLTGGQLMRRKGQSMEFREHVAYQDGDDIRFVDWRASARRGQEHDLVARSFVAEEEIKLLISVDTRPTMALPEPEHERSPGLSKLLIARWLAEALARVAIEGGDKVHIHQLFDEKPSEPAPVASEPQLGRALARLTPARQEQPPVNLRPLPPCLPPTAVWVIITDCYFEPTADLHKLSRMIRDAQAGMCWVLLVDLDSWPYELARLGEEVWQIAVPSAPAELTVQFRSNPLRKQESSAADVQRHAADDYRVAVEQRIQEARRQFKQAAGFDDADYRHWAWEAEANFDPTLFFNQRFLADRHLQSIFVKQTI